MFIIRFVGNFQSGFWWCGTTFFFSIFVVWFVLEDLKKFNRGLNKKISPTTFQDYKQSPQSTISPFPPMLTAPTWTPRWTYQAPRLASPAWPPWARPPFWRSKRPPFWRPKNPPKSTDWISTRVYYEGTRQDNIYLQKRLDTTTIALETERQLNQIFEHQIKLLKVSVLRGKRKIQHLEAELNTYKRPKSDYDDIQKQVETLKPTTEIMILSKDCK